MSHLDLAEVRLYYTDTGLSGCQATVLLVHGWGGESGEWDPIVADLAADHRVVTVDLRGHGRSTAPAQGRYAPGDFATDLVHLLRHLEAPPVVAVGHSMGAQVVVALAADHPALVASLVALDPAYGADDAEMRRIPAEQEALRSEGSVWATRFVAGAHGPATPPTVRERHRRLMASADPVMLANAREAMYLAPDAFGSRYSAEMKLAALSCPVFTVMTTEARADWVRGVVGHKRSRVETITGAGHYLHEELPVQVAALLRSWTAGGSRGQVAEGPC